MSKNKKKISKQKVHKLDLIQGENKIAYLHDLAHGGNEESIKKLKKIIETDPDEQVRETAKIALDEAEYFYYSSNNEKEEKEFLLLKMVQCKEDRLFALEMKADTVKFELGKLDLDRIVDDKVMKNNPKMKDWPLGFSLDYYTTVKNKLEDVKMEIEYLTAWISAAKKMITTKRYKTIPEAALRDVHFDAEGDIWEDDDFNNCECEKYNER